MTKEITGHTTLIGLLGSPISHSISPMMHNEAFRLLGLDYVYLAFDVNEEQMPQAMNGLRSLNARGFNVTMPCKNKAATLCDKLSPAADIIGAVNTIVNDNGILTGHITDGLGYMRSLKEQGLNMEGKKMSILGAGGAATAIFVQAALDGVSEISIFSRPGNHFNHAKGVIDKLKAHTACKLHLYDLNDVNRLKQEISESALLTNGTSLGMAPNADASIISDPSVFHKDLFVSDIIYNPRKTKFLKLAKEAGCSVSNGLGMLLYQGAEAFKLWTGTEMPVDSIKEKYFSE